MEFEKIKDFVWTDELMMDWAIFYQNESGKPSPRSLIERFKKEYFKPIITEDGFAITEEDEVWWVDCSINSQPSTFSDPHKDIHKYKYRTANVQKDKYKFFKFQENAICYHHENKPRFSKKQIGEAIVEAETVNGLGGDFKNCIRNFKIKLGL